MYDNTNPYDNEILDYLSQKNSMAERSKIFQTPILDFNQQDDTQPNLNLGGVPRINMNQDDDIRTPNIKIPNLNINNKKAQTNNNLNTNNNTNIKNNNNIVKEAFKYLGKPYVWGANPASNTGMDCSSLVKKVIKNTKGMNIPRTASAQWHSNIGKRTTNPQAGDIVYFNFPNKRGVDVSHTGICADNNCKTIIDASHGAGKVRKKKLTPYYKKHIVGFKAY